MQELKQLLAQEEQKLQKIVKEMKKALENMPEGTLRISKRGNQAYYYHCTNTAGDIHHNGKYLRKNQLQLAKTLAQKDYNKKVLEVSIHRLEELHEFQKSIDGMTQIQEIYSKLDAARQKLLLPVVLPDQEYAEKWENVKYAKKPFREDSPEIYTDKGERVRSKSEKILADRFYRMNIPYRYEYPLYLNGNGTFHPDFMLLNKRTRKEYYWEHCGMMDNPNYCSDMVSRMGIYAKNGIIQGKQLIVTYETLETPLNQKMIDEYIDIFLC
jgi:hypothetical protein